MTTYSLKVPKVKHNRKHSLMPANIRNAHDKYKHSLWNLKHAKSDKTSSDSSSIGNWIGLISTAVPTLLSLFAKKNNPANNTNNTIVPPKTTEFNTWAGKCAASVSSVGEDGKLVYSNDVEGFKITGEEYKKDYEENEGKNGTEVYKNDALKLAQGEISLYDTDGDGKINLQEQIQRDLQDGLSKYGELDADSKAELKEKSIRAFSFIDLDGDEKIDDKEYAAFLATADANNGSKGAIDGICDGEMTRDEYMKTAMYFETSVKDNPEAVEFRGCAKKYYEVFFGVKLYK